MGVRGVLDRERVSLSEHHPICRVTMCGVLGGEEVGDREDENLSRVSVGGGLDDQVHDQSHVVCYVSVCGVLNDEAVGLGEIEVRRRVGMGGIGDVERALTDHRDVIGRMGVRSVVYREVVDLREGQVLC